MFVPYEVDSVYASPRSTSFVLVHINKKKSCFYYITHTYRYIYIGAINFVKEIDRNLGDHVSLLPSSHNLIYFYLSLFPSFVRKK